MQKIGILGLAVFACISNQLLFAQDFKEQYKCLASLQNRTMANPFRCSFSEAEVVAEKQENPNGIPKIPVVIQSIEDPHHLYFFQADGVYEYKIAKIKEDEKKFEINNNLETKKIEYQYSLPGSKEPLLQLLANYQKTISSSDLREEKFVVHMRPKALIDSDKQKKTCNPPECNNILLKKMGDRESGIIFNSYFRRWLDGWYKGRSKSCSISINRFRISKDDVDQVFSAPTDACKKIPNALQAIESLKSQIKRNMDTVPESTVGRDANDGVMPVYTQPRQTEPKKSNRGI